ncbi:hypothetical protein [Aquimarina algiphila]|uniref:hypothetical protein n=1 Tax=Aquimarina algiphila TaxID=2047982 RepID=UPI00232E797A|nr:hypothetical protein [Aquimarina algiphila]
MNQLSRIIIATIFKVTLLILSLFFASDLNAQNTSYAVNYNRNKTTIKVQDGMFNNFSINYEGEITLSNDDKDVIAISDGGYLEIKKSAFGSKRRIVIESEANGNLNKKYFVGSSRKDFASEGKKWLSEILPEVVKTTALGAKGRVNRFYSQGGANSVFNEIRTLKSDHVKSKYFKLVLEKNLSSNELESLLRVAGKEINSDHYLSDLLKYRQHSFFASSSLVSAYIDATKSINSDHYVTSVLSTAIEDASFSDDQVGKLFEITAGINSDHYMSQVLMKVMKKRELNDANLMLLINNSRQIASDHYKSQVLLKALDLPELSKGNYNAFLGTLRDIQSDHYITAVFSKLLDEKLDANELSGLIRLAGESVSSDHYMSQVLSKLISKQGLNGDNLDVLIGALSSVGSDHYSTVILKKLARKNLSESQLVSVFRGMSQISSDHYLSESLIAFAPSVNASGDNVKEAYRDACKTISSETYYGRALRAIK